MKRNAWKLGTLAATLALIGGLLSGCAWSIGEHKDHSAPTRGQELMDLKRAKDTGAITEEEYQAQKQRILGK
jgi:hypothetical protein